jgi:hypothetical protein
MLGCGQKQVNEEGRERHGMNPRWKQVRVGPSKVLESAPLPAGLVLGGLKLDTRFRKFC